MASRPPARNSSRARSAARRLALQAIYQWQLNTQPWQDLHQQFGASEEMQRADPEYFRELLERVVAGGAELDETIAESVDRPVKDLDPVEHAVLLIGAYELQSRPDVPYRVVINEGVDLARRFGATDGHKFVNAVLDRLAARLRPEERARHERDG
jgi:N utilization substance protein B